MGGAWYWLTKPKSEWPKFEGTEKSRHLVEEERRNVILLAQVVEVCSIKNVISLSKYSTIEQVVKVTAWVLRFKGNILAM